MTTDSAPLPPLGALDLVGQAFRLLFAHFGRLYPLAFVPALALALINWLVIPQPVTGGLDPAASPLAAVSAAQVVIGFLSLLATFLVTGVMSLAALDAVIGKRHTIGEYTAQALRHLLPIAVLGLLVSIATGIGMLFLLVPGFYIAARYLPWVPAVVFENAGWSGLGRARDLTQGYRWPLVGAVLLMGLLVVGLVLLLALAPGLDGGPGGAVGVLLNAALDGLSYAIVAIFTALAYVRLREVKEGLSAAEIAATID